MDFKTIKRPYLIQRGIFKKIDLKDVAGLDSLMNYDYMGSAEFEFGALPYSLTRICQGWDKYVITCTAIKDKAGDMLWVACRENQLDDILVAVKHFSENQYGGKLRTKEFVGIWDHINRKNDKSYKLENSWCRADFWWDVDNDWMVCFGKDHITKLVTAINRVCTKKNITHQKVFP